MVKHYLNSTLKNVTGFNRFSKFLLIGNKIDGYVNINNIEFENFEQAKTQLPNIIKDLEFGGEWHLSFYQVQNDYAIQKLYGYYKVPIKGKRIFEFSYMNAGQENELLISNNLIHFISKSKFAADKWDDDNEHWDFELYEDYLTIILKENIDQKEFKNDDYPGDAAALENDVFTTK